MSNFIKVETQNVFVYDFVMLDNFDKIVLLQLKASHCRNKKDIATFINGCDSLKKLDDFLKGFNLSVVVDKNYTYCKCAYIVTKAVAKAKNNSLKVDTTSDDNSILVNIANDRKDKSLDEIIDAYVYDCFKTSGSLCENNVNNNELDLDGDLS